MSTRHKVFVSYHHANDQHYKHLFETRFGTHFGILERGSVELGDIDPNLQTETIRGRIRDEYLRDSSVTVVLVGTQTWQRKHVDWEIGSSLRHTQSNPRSGLLGILLPSFLEVHHWTTRADGSGKVTAYDKYAIPPRLHDNIARGFAELFVWSDDPTVTQQRIHAAYLRKSSIDPNNARLAYGKNRSGDRWAD